MTNSQNLFLIDRNVRRRAAICFHLTEAGLHVEPFETVSEFVARGRDGLVLAYDEKGVLDELFAAFEREDRWLAVIALSEAPEPASVVQAIRNGATDYLTWPADQDRLARLIEAPDDHLRPVVSLRRQLSDARRRVEQLTGREREVLACVANGMSNNAMAQRLGISRRTVEVYRANMLTKLAARNSPEAVRIAVDAGVTF